MTYIILAFGDCNTLGAGKQEKRGYPEQFATLIGGEAVNYGHTMATTREGLNLIQDKITAADCILVQFGLVDSYHTFKYSPYVLYYPDNFIRKPCRSLVKKYKKICKQFGLNQYLGEENVVPVDEYRANLAKMIQLTDGTPTFIIDTIPHRHVERNLAIQQYNATLTELCSKFDNCNKIDTYELFEKNSNGYYLDDTHSNEKGNRVIAELLMKRWTAIQQFP